MVFCHEHTQIIDGTICYIPLSDDLSEAIGEPVTLFKASSPYWADKIDDETVHRITDGPFMYRSKTDELFMLWSTFIKGKYAECLVKFNDGELGMEFTHLPPMIDDDGGHGRRSNARHGDGGARRGGYQVTEYVAPENDIEAFFTNLFGEILGLDEVSATDNFFEIGGTSLLVTKITMEALNRNYNLNYGDVFSNPTPRALL